MFARRLLQPLLWLLLLFPGVLLGQPATPDVRVLIDVSGSMQQNDPDNLRRPAVALLARLMPANARAGIWSFGTNSHSLVPLTPVDKDWRRHAVAAAEVIDSRSLYTDIPGALRVASDDTRGAGRRSIILLTDGMVDVSRSEEEDQAARNEVLQEILPRLRREGFTVHTIALSDKADRQLLERLALDTGGVFAIAASADELERIFLAALDAAAPGEQLPFKGQSFLVDSSINEFTALVFRAEGDPPTELTGPDGVAHSAARVGDKVRWLSTDQYDLITVDDPFEGEWRLATAPNPGSRVTIVSDLNLAVTPLPASLFAGPELRLEATLLEQGQPLAKQELLQLVEMRLTIERAEDSRQWQVSMPAVTAPARFAAALPMLSEPGHYRLRISLDGKTFQRQQQQQLTVRAPFRLRLTETGQTGEGGLPIQQLQLEQISPDWDSASIQAIARIRTPVAGASQELTASSERQWQTRFTNWQQPGSYSLYLEIRGRGTDSEPRSWRSQQLTVEQQPAIAQALPAEAEQTPEESAPEPSIETPSASTDSNAGEGMPNWVWISALIAGNIALIAGLWFLWRRLQKDSNSSLLGDELEDEEDDTSAVTEVEKPTETKAKEAEPVPETASPDLDSLEPIGEENSVLDEPLDLPDDAIDLDPEADSKKP